MLNKPKNNNRRQHLPSNPNSIQHRHNTNHNNNYNPLRQKLQSINKHYPTTNINTFIKWLNTLIKKINK